MANLIPQHFKHWQNVLMIVVCLLLFLTLVYIPMFDAISLIHVSVADGNGTLSLGTWGYCLYLPNKDCHYLFKIGQFFLLP